MTSVFKLPISLQHEDETQGELAFELNGGAKIHSLGWGVLNDGTPFLTQRGLAVICGVENAHIGTISTQWCDALPKPRISKIRDILQKNGHFADETYRQVFVNGRSVYAYPEEISLAIIEYYAFDAGQFCQEEARDNFRILARMGFRDAIYKSVGYAPEGGLSTQWQPFLDRTSLNYNSAPDGYFSIFREIAELNVTLGQAGLFANDAVIPDISVGKAWSTHWTMNGLALCFGDRLEYKHFYPTYFPQSTSNPQTPWCYPEHALPAFRAWFRNQYLRGGKLSVYLEGQIKRGQIQAVEANRALAAYELKPLQASRAPRVRTH